jgi:glycosyltransferase involved in cell wall biosynthesis
MKILVLDEWVPFPLNTGKKLRTYNLMKRLASHHSIDYLCYSSQEVDREAISHMKSIGISVIPVYNQIIKNGISYWFKILINIFQLQPFAVKNHFSKIFKDKFINLIQKKNYDILWCEWTPYAEFLRDLEGKIKILSSHNVEALAWKRFTTIQKNPFKKIIGYLQWKKMFKFEKNSCLNFTHIFAVSENDRDLFKEWYGCQNITVIPNGVDVDYFTPMIAHKDPYNIIFSASMDAFVNQDAVDFFILEILPKVKKLIPNATFTIVGKDPPRKILKYKKIHGVEITGTVPDVRPFLAKAGLVIVPIRIGGGSRLKILEAFSMSKPVISTLMGAEGLLVENGENILLAQDNDQLIGQILRVMSNDNLAQALGENGRKLVANKYSWEIIASDLLNKINEIEIGLNV